MNKANFDAELTSFDAQCNRILGYKNDKLYAKGVEDRLHNFKVGAEISGMTPAQMAWGYMVKHLAALRDKIINDDFSDLYDLREKCVDIVNYVRFIYLIGLDTPSTDKPGTVDTAAAEIGVSASGVRYVSPVSGETCSKPPYKRCNKSDNDI